LTVWRRPILRRVDFGASWELARQQYSAVVNERDILANEVGELIRERDALQCELTETGQALRELRAAVLERNRAYDNLHVLQRERDIVRARHAERGPDTPLH
jgi:hypothetical protein